MLDVMKERERKRKRELGMEDDAEAGADAEVDGEAEEVVEKVNGNGKRQRVEGDADASEAKRRAKADKRKEKREAKREKLVRKQAKLDARKAAKQNLDLHEANGDDLPTMTSNGADEDGDMSDAEAGAQGGDFEFDASGLTGSDKDDAADDNASEPSSVPSSPLIDDPAFDASTNHSAASSSSSIVPPSLPEIPTSTQTAPTPKAAKSNTPASKPNPALKAITQLSLSDIPSGASSPKLQLPKVDQAELQERLRLRIEELRAKRKADGPDGKPAKTRQDLLEERRKTGEKRKAAKKDQRRKQKEDEARKADEQLRGSGSPLSADIFSPRSPRPTDNNFSFSRLAFDDGTTADASLTGLSEVKKKKGPQDPKTALEAAEKKAARIAGLDEGKKADIAEKDLWLNAKKRAHGERVRDDTSLLKKALKRKEKGKSKSEAEWTERKENVVKGREMKQKKREGNLQKRVEGKKGGPGATGKGKGGGVVKKGGKQAKKDAKAKKKEGRPGFEGRFKA